MKKIWRWLGIAVLLVVLVGLAAPRVSANRFRPRIEAALEAALNRPVTLGAVHLNLFTGPGFTVDDVLIDDDPAAGIEPFAHVEHMQARIRWSSLFSGQLAFSSLRLDTPSVNVVKMPSGPWNIQPLLDRHTAGGARIAATCRTFRSAADASTSSSAIPSPSSTSATPTWMFILTKMAKW